MGNISSSWICKIWSLVEVTARFCLGPTYPDEAPEIVLSSSSELSDDELSFLTDKLKQEAQNNLGMAMTFTLISAAQEWLTSTVEDPLGEAYKEQQSQDAACRTRR
eukprot:m.86516 g.86516  ORF g.86516 m.86516 type:complete len:106 (+) comp36502_c0_seq4:170-487(+)